MNHLFVFTVVMLLESVGEMNHVRGKTIPKIQRMSLSIKEQTNLWFN